jgi:carbonic anhydrase
MVFDLQFVDKLVVAETHLLPNTVKTYGEFSNLYATDIDGNLFGYEAREFHFHAPSEHKVEGTQYDLEMHIVHSLKADFTAEKRNYAVVGIFFQVDDNEVANTFLSQFDADKQTEITLNLKKVLGSLVISYLYIHED